MSADTTDKILSSDWLVSLKLCSDWLDEPFKRRISRVEAHKQIDFIACWTAYFRPSILCKPHAKFCEHGVWHNNIYNSAALKQTQAAKNKSKMGSRTQPLDHVFLLQTPDFL